MALKRTTHVNWGTPSAKRLKKLEQVVYTRNLGEVKTISGHLPVTQIVNGNLNAQCLTKMNAGANQGQRVGNEIRVRSVMVRGFCPVGVDIYLIQSKDGPAPTMSNFTPTMGAVLTQGANATLFNEWQHNASVIPAASPASTGNEERHFKMKQRFSIPMKVRFTGPTDAELGGNQLWLVILNKSGFNQNVQWSYTMNYID